MRLQKKSILGGVERDRLGGNGGGGHNLSDHSSQDWMSMLKGLIGVACGSTSSGTLWSSLLDEDEV